MDIFSKTEYFVRLKIFELHESPSQGHSVKFGYFFHAWIFFQKADILSSSLKNANSPFKDHLIENSYFLLESTWSNLDIFSMRGYFFKKWIFYPAD